MTTPRQQLLLVKNLFQEAEQAAAREDNFSTSKGILFLDLAVEQMLLTILTSLPTKLQVPKGELKFDQLWQASTDVMTENGHTLPGKVSLRNVHQDRNRVQHAGSTFHFTQLRKYVGPVQNMIASVFQDAFGLDFDRFREWDLIGCEDLRRWLKESEDLLAEGNVPACIVGCTMAHRWIMEAIREQTKHRRMRYSLSYEGRRSPVARDLQEIRKELLEDILLMENEVVAIGIGLPVMETRRFLQSTRIINASIAIAGNLSIRYKGDPREKDREVANFMLGYMLRLIQLVEDGYPGVLNTIKIKIFPKEQKVWAKANI